MTFKSSSETVDGFRARGHRLYDLLQVPQARAGDTSSLKEGADGDVAFLALLYKGASNSDLINTSGTTLQEPRQHHANLREQLAPLKNPHMKLEMHTVSETQQQAGPIPVAVTVLDELKSTIMKTIGDGVGPGPC